MTIGCSVSSLPFVSTLRARIAGAVIRLPGTGDGVARLVDVSIVKVDIVAAFSLTAVQQPARQSIVWSTMGNFTALLFFPLTSPPVFRARLRSGVGNDRSPMA